MSRIQNRKAQNAEKPFPGCLGRMVNLLDLGAAAPGNRLLADKPHRDGSSLSRSRSDVARISGPAFGDVLKEKQIVSELGKASHKKSSVMPMKMLLDQEMSKELKSKHNSPNVIAKLMGLDTLPLGQPGSVGQRSHRRGYSQGSVTDSAVPLGSWEEEIFLDKKMQCQIHPCSEQKEYRDVYEIWHQSPPRNYVREKSPQKGSHNENMSDRKMALVRQKFMEAKRLATDEKLRQSREFQDALEVLSSNRDLFVKFLQEPHSLFSQHMYEFQSIPPSPETKRITVLRPSKIADNVKATGLERKSEKQTKKPAPVSQAAIKVQNDFRDLPTLAKQIVDEYPVQPTRIVVLKPSPGKVQDMKPVVASPCLSSVVGRGDEFDGEPEIDETQDSTNVAEEITGQMHEHLRGHRRDETLLSSVFSNGYTGDESSFNKSENECAIGNLSDSEALSPSSRHSWDYINRTGSPFSSSSFSRASCSPESSVCREAKKRLSERWAMVASHGKSQEQRHVRRSSSTLGEMLALTDTKKLIGSEREIKEQEPRESVSCVVNNLNEECKVESPRSLVRSKSVPVSSTACDSMLNLEVPDSATSKIDVQEEVKEAKGMKSSFKGKVSRFFFSRNKKSGKEKNNTSQAKSEPERANVCTLGTSARQPGKITDDPFASTENRLEKCTIPTLPILSGTSPELTDTRPAEGLIFQEAGLSVTKPVLPKNLSESLDQPSPISVLEPPFDEDDSATLRSPALLKPANQGHQEAPIKSNLIDKSPPIGSIARTLSWDDTSCSDTATMYPNWQDSIRTLLRAAGLDGEVQCASFFSRWHSPETPLDPSLRDKFSCINGKEVLHEAKRRQLRSSRKLLFDCVNAALLDIRGYGLDSSTRVMSLSGDHGRFVEGSSPMLVDRVWDKVKEWFSVEARCVADDNEDSNSLVVESVVRKEVVGKGWVDNLRMEICHLGKEMEGNLLEELLEEAVVDMTGGV